VLDLKPGDIFACPEEPHDADEQVTFRLVEIQAVSADEVHVWCYSDVFAKPPRLVDVSTLRRVKLHESLGGPVALSKAEFRSWGATAVGRA
jgi:hypothetical protein